MGSAAAAARRPLTAAQAILAVWRRRAAGGGMPTGIAAHETLVERQIRLAQERGDFDDLPGKGKPLPGLDGPDDENWWVKGYLRREGLSAEPLLPTPLQLRREIERLPDTVAGLPDERTVRDVARELNRRIAQWLRAPGRARGARRAGGRRRRRGPLARGPRRPARPPRRRAPRRRRCPRRPWLAAAGGAVGLAVVTPPPVLAEAVSSSQGRWPLQGGGRVCEDACSARERGSRVSRPRACPTVIRTRSAGPGRRAPNASGPRTPEPVQAPVATSSRATTGLTAVCHTTAWEPYSRIDHSLSTTWYRYTSRGAPSLPCPYPVPAHVLPCMRSPSVAGSGRQAATTSRGETAPSPTGTGSVRSRPSWCSVLSVRMTPRPGRT